MKNDGITPPVKRLSGGGITRNTQQTLRKIAGSLLQRGDISNASYSFTRARAFVVGKEESLVFADWTTKGEAKLVADVFRRRFVSGREKVARIERGVAMKFVERAVKVVGAGLEHHVYLRAGITTEGGVVGARRNFKFSYGIDWRAYGKGVELWDPRCRRHPAGSCCCLRARR